MKQLDCRGFSWRPKVVEIVHIMNALEDGEQLEIIADQESVVREVEAYVHMTSHNLMAVIFHPAGTQCQLDADPEGTYRLAGIQPADPDWCIIVLKRTSEA
ncbi:MAG: sulfurtransferase TusA family protein [Sulfobacillus sp.]